jgi:hypothetical protein
MTTNRIRNAPSLGLKGNEPKGRRRKRTSIGHTVGCKIENTGDVVIIYGFVRTKPGWKFNSLDNINE